MEKLIMLSPGRTTSINLSVQLEEVFGKYIKIEPYCLEDDLDFNITNSLVVLSSPRIIKGKIKSLVDRGLNYIIAQRVINHRYISELLDLPKATEVLLVNDRAETTYQTIEQLEALGINYIKYHPYYPGIDSYPRLNIAVTVGEPNLVPYAVKKVINIGTRQIDIITLADIARRLGLIDKLADKLSSQYVNEIIELLNQINDYAKGLKIVSSRLDTIANCLSKAILYIKNDGTILVSNQELHNILGYSRENIIGKNINDILPQITVRNHNKSEIVTIHNNTLFVTAKVIEGQNSEDGIIYIFEKSEEIEKNEHKIRRMTTRKAVKSYYTFDDIIYESKEMEKLVEKARTFAATDSTILIEGESGTGKELFAQAIHSASRRANGPFVPVNFSSIPINLIESELFGYEEGSFTGAIRGGKRGLFEEAHGGTIFLDEIGDASLESQCTLLRVIQERQVRRVGSIKEIPVDVRIIVATNKNLVEEVNKGNFRSDLYYRLNILPLRTLSLRERKSDIFVLANHFIKNYSNGQIINIEQILDNEAIKALYEYDWPGNIRQLENAMEYLAVIWQNGKKLSKNDLPEYIISGSNVSKNTLLLDILGKDMLWLLSKLKNSDGLGRRYLAEFAKNENIPLTEGQIRNLINKAESLGFVKSYTGRQGTILTEKGYAVISLIKI
ncbi:sigma 54-interacting transcriptional regulator [Tepidanaerobacter sp. EBM-49]|uniref:sigma-54 interaction domain-containing protein n=1 Tax=Tepidanaerobacter sp. EBM-49 TaxID=1918504 RepID=UPI000ACFB8B3|nr:sigma 54-interacting transcriptional regulator [Tepidanaerobacter sp. EBM-49]